MLRQQKNKIKALLLLLVFSLNTLAGFACSVGVNMGYNSHHHEHSNSHVHKLGKKQHKHKHNHKHQHRHQAATSKFSITGENDDCCANSVASFTLLDKAVADNYLKLQSPVFLLAFTTAFFSQTITEPGAAVNSRFQFVRRSCFLNDTDLRIAIQSFQI